MTIALPVILLLLFLFVGMPVGFSLGISGLIGLFLAGGVDAVFSIMSTVPFRTAANYTLTTVPMFILMAQFISESGIVTEVFTAARRWLERLPGGLAIASVFASAGVAAMSGSSTASAATMASVTIPEMKKHGYSVPVAAGVVTVAGTLAIMIPPSIGLVLYGIITENSIGQLLIAGLIPGGLTALTYVVGILVWNKLKPGVMPPTTSRYSWKERFRSLRPLWAFIVLGCIVLGSIYLGLATPTEAAAVGAFGALVIPLARRTMSWGGFKKAVGSTIRITTMIFTIIIGAMIFGYFLTITQATQNLIALIGEMNAPPWLVLGIIMCLILVLGCMLDQVAILLITLPLVYPLVMSLGYDPIWFGVICIKLGEIGLVTPPVGMNAYVVSAAADVPLEDIFSGIGMMLVFEFVSMVLLLAFPIITLWLPTKMF
jgi:C4-dicarboxylate transporter DctM subunit